jgi:hypothetical protein
MHIGVIRGDLPGPVLLAGLEPVSQYNPPTEPRGQEVYISRPTTGEVAAALADPTTGAGAVLNGANISGSFPGLVINAGNRTLRVRLSAAPTAFTVALITTATYNTLAALIAAVNAALNSVSLAVTCRINVAGNGVALEADLKGVTSYIENDATASSTANTPLGLTSASTRTMPAAASFITASLPVGGPLDVSTATLNGVGAGTNANALSLIPASRGVLATLANAIAPKVGDTPVAIDSFIAGDLSQLLNPLFNPDPRRVPPLVNGPAIEVVQDDGVTPFAAAAPVITTATLDAPSPGFVTIVGTDMAAQGNPQAERYETVVKFIGVGAPPGGDLVIPQRLIESNGGSVTATQIVVPAALNPYGFSVTTTSCQLQYRSFASNIEVLV